MLVQHQSIKKNNNKKLKQTTAQVVNHQLRLAVLTALPMMVMPTMYANAACTGTIASPVSASITEQCSGVGVTGNVNNTDAITRVDSTATATAGNNTLLQFDGHGRTLDNTGSIINNRVITGTAGARGRTAVLIGAATVNAGAGTSFGTAPQTGDTTLTLNGSTLTNAFIGQSIVVGRYDAADADFFPGEVRIITAINGNQVTLDSPLSADFAGSADSALPLRYAVVSNFGEGTTVDGAFYNNVINNSGIISTRITKAEIDGNRTGATSVSNTAAARAINSAVKGSYLINNQIGASINVVNDGIGVAQAIFEGGQVEEMTINNAGTISAERTARLTLFSNTATANPTATSLDFPLLTTAQTVGVVGAIVTEEEAEEIVINNTSTGVIRGKGDYASAIYSRAEEAEIVNAGLIEHIATDGTQSKGFAIGHVSNGGEVRRLEIENTTTGIIRGDILSVNGNAFRWYNLSTEGNLDSRLGINSQNGQADSEIENAGKIYGNIYYGNGTHVLENESTGEIVGNIDLDQRNMTVAAGAGIAGTKSFTFENEGIFNGNITIHDVATSLNSLTLEGDGFTGKITASTGAGNTTLNLLGSGTLRDDVTKLATLNMGATGDTPVDDDDDEVTGGSMWSLASGKTFEFSQGANLNAGTLNVLGNLVANTQVNSGATLAGTGTITGNVTSQGIVNLADTVLTVNGNFISQTGGAINADITSDNNGLLAVSGTANINGTTIRPQASFTVANGSTYTLLTSDGLTFTDSAVASSALLKWSLVSDANNLIVTVQAAPVTSIAGVGTAGAITLNNILTNTNNVDALNNLALRLQDIESEAAIVKASAQLSPEVNGANYLGAQVAVNQFSNLIDARSDANAAGVSGVATGDATLNNGVWLQGFGFVGEQKQRKGADGFDADTAGFAIGYDHDISDHVRIGAAVAYSTTNVDANNLTKGNTTSIDSYQAVLYGTYNFSNWYLDSQLGYAQHQFDSKRLVSVPVRDVANGSFDANQYTARLSANYPIKVGNNATFIPTVAAMYSYFDQESYRENSQLGTGLSINSKSTDSLRLGLGGKALFELGQSAMPVVFETRALWWHEFADVRQDSTARFATGGSTFNTNGIRPARDTANLGATLSASSQDFSQVLSVSYDAEVRDHYVGHTGSLTARFNF